MLEPEELIGPLEYPPISKTLKRYARPEILQDARERVCAIHGCGVSPCDPSHTVKKGRGGNNAHDIWVLSLCRFHHTKYESMKVEDFEREYQCNIRELTLQQHFDFLDSILDRI